ncbi:PREDICTED: UPF0553 protein C9orf64 homolog isoform X1 [Priapulus caudatus]|uniref:Queuosine 5'-phosphate N-glycosylase/hydrolase n=1 Tax=Priapulus caudatus TaxID=37621 RepID=A0ABM1DR42_PRICU|nr:PREDICTED: UPF0553 protein C9orf64 homolog isoform X1 [Priapulus caudatus]XP_014662413.1 PREDICTED: UPF0553 protein C9orf64 homolog isoform X1 [Priapulus caudatus]XP_014662414.1 PREDICTED: UPF0553 protein C9orf64 homolog isoform X1 [Priapulus caudatus]
MVAMKDASSCVMPPREAAAFIAESAKDVKILPDGVEKLAHHLADVMGKNKHKVNENQLPDFNPKTADRAAVDWVFFIDTLNFSFWSEDERRAFTVRHRGRDLTGYFSLCAAVNRSLEAGVPLTDPAYYSTLTLEKLREHLRGEDGGEMPMMQERLANIREAGSVLVEKFSGSFLTCVERSNKSASCLLRLILDNFPSYRDETTYVGRRVALWKRAQILVADIWLCCEGKGHGEFHDIDTLTMFADYRIPQALVYFGVLEYSQELLDLLLKGHLFQSGDRKEVEIRGASIWAVELVLSKLRALLQTEGAAGVHVNAVMVDFYLWDLIKAKTAEGSSQLPFHHIRCIYY